MKPVRIARLAAVLGVCLPVLGSTSGEAPSALGGVRHDAGVVWEDCIECYNLGGDEVGEHEAPDVAGDNERSGGSHDEPWPGSCTGWILRYSPVLCEPAVAWHLADSMRDSLPFRAVGAQLPLPPASRRRSEVVVLPARGSTLAWAGS
jgi:hypothetical protein